MQRLILIFGMIFILAGCTGFYEQQPPAPVYNSHRAGNIQPAPRQGRAKTQRLPVHPPPPVVSTKPLESFKQELSPIETAPPSQPSSSELPEAFEQEPEEFGISSEPSPEQDAAATPDMPEQENLSTRLEQIAPEPEVKEMTTFEPIEPSASFSPAVGALVIAANQNSQSGDVEMASSSIDRALKIEPRNPALYYKLALLRLKQSKPQEAEDLAKKSALLAGADKQLKKQSWLLIAHARELRRDFSGAREARVKADSF